MESRVFKVDGMSCQHCKKSVESTLESIEGLQDFEVSLEDAEARVNFNEKLVNAHQIEDTFKDSNYQVQVK